MVWLTLLYKMTAHLRRRHSLWSRGLVSRAISSALVGLVLLGFGVAAKAASMDRAEAIVSQAPDLVSFLAREDLVNQYYDALAEFYGKDHFPRKYFDDVLGQLKGLSSQFPILAERLWEKTGLGTSFRVEAIGSSDSLTLDKNAWDKIYSEWRSGTGTSASKFSQGLTQMQAQEKLHALFSKIEAETKRFESELAKTGKSRSAKASETAQFYQDLKRRSEVRDAVGYIIDTKLKGKSSLHELQSHEPIKILYLLHATRNTPEKLLEGSVLPGLIRSALKEAIPNPDDLLSRGVITPTKPAGANAAEVTSNGIRASRAALSEVWEFESIPRRIHGIFKGIPAKECVGGCHSINEIHLMPERWATSALDESKIFNVKRSGVYNGFIQVTPVQMEAHTYGAIDIVSAALSRRLLVKDSDGTIQRVSLFESAYRKLTEQMPKGWAGYVVGDSRGIDNAGAKGAVYSSLAYVDGKDLGPGSSAVVQDQKMKSVIVGWFGKKSNLASSYSNGEPIVEAVVKTTNRVVLLGPPRYEKGEFDDAAWIAKRFHSEIGEEVRVFSAFSNREPANKLVRTELKKEAHVISDAFEGKSGEAMKESAKEFFLLGNEDAILAYFQFLYEPIGSSQDYLAQLKQLKPYLNSQTKHVRGGAERYIESTFTQFLMTGVTPADIHEARMLVNSSATISFHIRAIEAGMDRAQSMDDVLKTMVPSFPDPGSAYCDELVKVFEKRLPDLDRLRPPLTVDDYVRLDKQIAAFSRVEAHEVLLEKAVRLVKTPSDFLKLVEFRIKNPSDAYREAIDSFVVKHTPLLEQLETKPRISQLVALMKKLRHVETIAPLHRLAVKISTTPGELFSALEYTVSNPSSAYKAEMEKIVSQSVDHFMDLGPSVGDIVTFRKKFVQTKELDADLIRRGMTAVRSTEDYFRLIEPIANETAQDFETYRGRAIYDTFPKLLDKTKLTSEEFQSLVSLSPRVKELYDRKTNELGGVGCVIDQMQKKL